MPMISKHKITSSTLLYRFRASSINPISIPRICEENINTDVPFYMKVKNQEKLLIFIPISILPSESLYFYVWRFDRNFGFPFVTMEFNYITGELFFNLLRDNPPIHPSFRFIVLNESYLKDFQTAINKLLSFNRSIIPVEIHSILPIFKSEEI